MIHPLLARLVVMAMLGLMIAASALAQLPEETVIDTSGTLELIVFDYFENHRSEIHYYLNETGTGHRFNLTLTTTLPAGIASGARVHIRGRRRGDEIVLAPETSGGMAGIGGLEIMAGGISAAAAVTGNQSTIIMIINFTNSTVTSSAETISNLVFGITNQSVNTCYQEGSYSNVSWSGKVVGPYTLNYASSGCDPDGWANAADFAANAAGESIGLYTHKVYVVPGNMCGWCGLGTIGGNPSRAWIGCYDNGAVFAHEMGHNLGMGHASNDPNNLGVVEDEYGDNSDFMASPFDWRHSNAPHKDQMGWLPANKVAAITASGTYQAGPVEANPGTTAYVQAFKIAVPASPKGYYLSYKRAIGFDANLGSAWADRLSIHRYSSGAANTLFITALADGESYRDAATGLTFAQVSHDTNASTFTVAFGSATPLPFPWQSTDVGKVILGGWANTFNAVTTVTASGSDIWGTADSFRYTYLTLSGTGEIRARVLTQANTDPWSKCGVMIRESLGADSKQALLCATPGNGFALQYRSATGGNSSTISGGALNAAPNNWVRLVRSGGTLTAYKSANGASWTVVSALSLSMNPNVYVGLAVVSHDNSQLNTSTFDNVAVTGASAGTGLTGEYYDNIDFTGTKLTRIDPTVNFDWDTGAPAPSMGVDTFSVRWTGEVQPLYSQSYSFYTATDDGVRLWVNGQLLIDKWVNQSPTEWSNSITLTASQKYNLRMDYFENGGGAGAKLSWSSASQAKEIIPKIQLYPLTNQPPFFTSSPFSKPDANAGQHYSSSIATNAADPNSDALTFAMLSGPAWLSLAANGGLSGTPVSADAGTNSFLVRVTDPAGLFNSVSMIIRVIPAPPLTATTTWQGASLLLSWTGGVAPYQVQTTADLGAVTWQNVGVPTTAKNLLVTPAGTPAFYRITGR